MAAPSRVANNQPSKRQPAAPAAAQQKSPPPEDDTPPSRLAWFIGWVAVPGTVFGVIFGGGVLVGAHYPDGWISWSVRGIASLFGG